MAKKAKNKWTETKLRQAIQSAICDRCLQNKPVDTEAIRARYLGKAPKHAHLITNLVVR